MNVEKLREKYLTGTRIELNEMNGEVQMISGLKGTVQYIDDIGQIHMNWDNGSTLALNVDEDSFKIIEEKPLISVLYVEPDKYPRMMEIEESLEAIQELLDGDIEEYMPFDDEVAIVCNAEGKIRGEELNRAIYGKNKQVLDIIAGKFFVCYAPIESEKFLSLTKEQEQKYKEKFKYPEKFHKTNEGIVVQPFKPVSKDMER